MTSRTSHIAEFIPFSNDFILTIIDLETTKMYVNSGKYLEKTHIEQYKPMFNCMKNCAENFAVRDRIWPQIDLSLAADRAAM